MIRLYFNAHGDLDKLWSIDHGPGTPELQVPSVHIRATDGRTRYNPDADNKLSSKAWIEFDSAVVYHGHCVYGEALIDSEA